MKYFFLLLIFISSVLWMDFVSFPIINLFVVNIYPIDLFLSFSMIFLFSLMRERKLGYKIKGTPLTLYLLLLVYFSFEILRNIFVYKQSAIGDGRSVFPFFFFFITYFYSQKFSTKEFLSFSNKIILLSAFGAFLLFIIELSIGHLFSFSINNIKEADYGYLTDPRGVRILGSNDTFTLCIFSVWIILSMLYQNKRGIVNIILLVASITASLISQNRTAIISIIFSFLIYLIFTFKIKRIKKLLFYISTSLAIVIFIINFYFAKDFYLSVRQTIISTFNPAEDRIGTGYWRLLAVQSAMSNFPQHPIFGEGFGKHWILFINNKIFFLPPHNQYVLMLIKTGLVGLILLISIFYLVIRSFLKYRKYIGSNSRPIFDTMFIALIAALPYGMGFEFYPYFGLYFGIYVGILIKGLRDLRNKRLPMEMQNNYA